MAFEEKERIPLSFAPFEVISPATVEINLVDPAGDEPKACVSNLVPQTSTGEMHVDNILQIVRAPSEITYDTAADEDNVKKILKDQLRRFSFKKQTKITSGSTKPNTKESSLSGTSKSSFKSSKMVVKTKEQNRLVFEAVYEYDYDPIAMWGLSVAPFILRYIWKSAFYSPTSYTIFAETCRYKRIIDVLAFPDIKWSASIALNLGTNSYEVGHGISPTKNQTIADREAKEKAKKEKAKISTKEKIEFELKVTLGKGGEIDISAPFKKVVDGVKMLLNSPIENLQKTVDGDINTNDGEHAEPSAEDREAVEKIKKRKKRDADQDAKDAKDAVKELEANEKEIKRLNNEKNPDKKALEKAMNRRRALQVKTTQKAKLAGLDIKRDALKFDIIKPNFKFTASWYMEGSKSINSLFKHQVANIVDGTFEATPLIGVKITLDLLACAQRGHPALLAFIAACDIALGLIGGDSEMAFNIKASGDIKGTISFTLNTLTKEKKLGKDAKLSSTMKLIIEAHIIAKKKIEVLKITTMLTGGVKSVEAGFELGIAAEARWLAEGNIDADDEGIFMDSQWSFEGLEFSGYASVTAKVEMEKDKNGDQKTYGTEKKAEFKYIAIDKQESHPLGKFYLNHT